MSASSGETSRVGPAPCVAQQAGGDEVDGALAPAGALHEQAPGGGRRARAAMASSWRGPQRGVGIAGELAQQVVGPLAECRIAHRRGGVHVEIGVGGHAQHPSDGV